MRKMFHPIHTDFTPMCSGWVVARLAKRINLPLG
jgi:hypothetical protein